jgi:uncharacterized protein (DUF362 family)
MNCDVVYSIGESEYPSFPYEPSESFPELIKVNSADEHNPNGIYNKVYSSVRSIFAGLGLDSANIGTERWNPFASFVSPGDMVLLKPNWVRDYNVILSSGVDCLLTHTSVIRPLIDYAAKALDYNGTIVIADAPLQSCDFKKLRKVTRIDELINFLQPRYPNILFIVEDWRLTVMDRQRFVGKGAGRRMNQGDESRCQVVDLGEKSFLTDLEDYAEQFRVTCYDTSLMLPHHTGGHHKYLVTKRIFEANLIINIPILKTHIKAGITGALKNLVGINGHKEYLPHHCKGGYESGGDNFYSGSSFKSSVEELDEWYWKDPNRFSPVIRALLSKTLGLGWKLSGMLSYDKITGGGWSGNDTLWRTIIDLNHILYFYDPVTDSLNDIPVRPVITIVDAVIAGQGEGPLSPTPKPIGMLYGGFNPAAVEMLSLKIIGYNTARIKSVSAALYDVRSKFNTSLRGEARFFDVTKDSPRQVPLSEIPSHNFKLPKHWKRCGINPNTN